MQQSLDAAISLRAATHAHPQCAPSIPGSLNGTSAMVTKEQATCSETILNAMSNADLGLLQPDLETVPRLASPQTSRQAAGGFPRSLFKLKAMSKDAAPSLRCLAGHARLVLRQDFAERLLARR